MTTPLPIQKLSNAYTHPESQTKRYEELKKLLPAGSFHTFARSPGRVNVISEHTDYNGYQVTPIALQNDFVFAVGAVDNGSHLVKIYHKLGKEGGCPADEFDYTQDVSSIAKPNNEWSQYVRAGFHAALFMAKKLNQDIVKSFGNREIHIVGTGNVPLGSGLSSSSALTCCSSLAFMSFLKPTDNFKEQLAAQVAHSESTVAIEGGGMDQAISLNGELGKISVINFNPIAVTNYMMPPNVRIAVFSSLKDSKKATGACNFYNTRVAECRAACALLI